MWSRKTYFILLRLLACIKLCGIVFPRKQWCGQRDWGLKIHFSLLNCWGYISVWLRTSARIRNQHDWIPLFNVFGKHKVASGSNDANYQLRGLYIWRAQGWVINRLRWNIQKYIFWHKFQVSSMFGSEVMLIGNFRNFPENFGFLNIFYRLQVLKM